jgi:hypothetical protein
MHVPPRTDNQLPLRMERSATEQRVQAQEALKVLAQDLGVDGTEAASRSEAIDADARRLYEARRDAGSSPEEAAKAWDTLAESLFELDAHTQDELAARSDMLASAYQLGRGLSETYWALNPDDQKGWSSWSFLFDQARVAELTRLMGRVGTCLLSPLSAPAIAGSLEVWRMLAHDTQWRAQPRTQADLYTQIRTWYELLVLEKDPSADIGPYQLITNWRATLRGAIAFTPQLLLAAIGVGGLLLLAISLSSKHGSGAWKALGAVAATVGLSMAGLSATVKSQAQVMWVRLRQDIYTDLVAVSITSVPPTPHRRRKRAQRAVVVRAVRRRALTSGAPSR